MVMHLIKEVAVLLYFVTSIVLFTIVVHPATQEDENKPSKRGKLSFSAVRQNNSGEKQQNSSSRFRILQLTDLHLGENSWTDWGPEQDIKTYNVLRKIIPAENPDLIILGGDQLTGNNVDANATAYYDRLAAFLEEESFRIPYALIFGNHDDADREVRLANGTIIKYPSKSSRTQLLRSNQRYANSMTEEGPTNVFGVSNYMLPVYVKNKMTLQVILMDSGGGSLPQQIVESQLGRDWYESERRKEIDAVAFQHIPTREFQYDSGMCAGLDGEHGVAALEHDPTKEISTLMKQDPKLHFLAVGHNHGNSYCCPTTAKTSSHLHVCFGRHSGYGGYGKKGWAKGGRVYDIALTPNSKHAVQWWSWVRLESGEVVDEYNPI